MTIALVFLQLSSKKGEARPAHIPGIYGQKIQLYKADPDDQLQHQPH